MTACRQGPPVPVLHIHGTADRNAPYDGGVGSKSYSGFHYPSVDETLAPWRSRNECRPVSETTHPSPDVRVDRWPGPADVVLYTIEGGGHSRPGGQRMSRFLDPPSEGVDATATIWEFFAAHARQP